METPPKYTIRTLCFGVVLALLLTRFASTFIKIARNRKLASGIAGIPIIVSPLSNANPLWKALKPWMVPLFRIFRPVLGNWTRYSYNGWTFEDKYKIHSELGDVFTCISPNGLSMFLADPEVVQDVVGRRRDFIKPVHRYTTLSIFGQNVVTLEGPDWVRHRNITSRALNDRTNEVVWTESVLQADQMLEWWARKGLIDARRESCILALKVLTRAVFGRSLSFLDAVDDTKSEGATPSQDSLSTILENIFTVLIIPFSLLDLKLSPKRWRMTGQAIAKFRNDVKALLENEQEHIAQGAAPRQNLASLLIRASEDIKGGSHGADETNEDAAWEQDPKSLDDEEIMGNLFLFHVAGHETTGNTMSYVMLMLAAHPQWQSWAAEEIRHVMSVYKSDEEWTYKEAFPKLKRTLALIHETLRLFPTVLLIPKYTGAHSQQLTISNRSRIIPPKTIIVFNVMALHTHPRHWSPDPLAWRPSRWITSSSHTSRDLPTILAHESLRQPKTGTFLPWSDGARVCTGKKFSQVEMVAVTARILRGHRLEPVMAGGETQADARARVMRVVEDNDTTFTLRMINAEKARVRCVRVGESEIG
ncbi:hypothetical protein MMC07_002397 [Pseudocyphellaria aurata]|nr:hypothetical protein [Pseudocyphellaria aurata]